jgi:CDP-diacylglycerol--glycerol-3-phosphate 3-phosphatidyltransferase
MKKLPNALTVFRMLATPALIALLLGDTTTGYFWALFLFVAAAISDYYDGKIARTLGARSRIGQFLDPLADKVLVLGTFFTLHYIRPDLVPLWTVLVIAARDLAVTLLRSWIESRGKSVKTLPLAKTKTTFQLTYLISMLVFLFAARLPAWPGTLSTWILNSYIPIVGLIAVVVITTLTGILYFINTQYSDEVDG